MNHRSNWAAPFNRRGFSARLAAGVLTTACYPALAAEPLLAEIQLTLIDSEAIHSATFQSHNQKVLASPRGIFLTYVKTRNADYTAQHWRLMHSRDAGATFTCVYEATQATNPPVIEIDDAGNLLLGCVDWVNGQAYLYRFQENSDWSQPNITTIPGGAAGKFAMALDRRRQQIIFFSHNTTFHTLGTDGKLLRSIKLLAPGKHAVIEYPSLCFAPDGMLYAAWTTVAHGRYLYWDIHVMASPDGGASWQTLAGVPLITPIVADELGPTDRITLDDEFEVTTWLSSFLCLGEHLHFVYQRQSQPFVERYARWNRHTGMLDLEHQPELRGQKLSLCGLDGLLAANAEDQPTLYCVMNAVHTAEDAQLHRLACLRSHDLGVTWQDHAVSSPLVSPYAVGGCRTVTPDGGIIGSFTDAIEPSDAATGKSKVYFYRIKSS